MPVDLPLPHISCDIWFEKDEFTVLLHCVQGRLSMNLMLVDPILLLRNVETHKQYSIWYWHCLDFSFLWGLTVIWLMTDIQTFSYSSCGSWASRMLIQSFIWSSSGNLICISDHMYFLCWTFQIQMLYFFEFNPGFFGSSCCNRNAESLSKWAGTSACPFNCSWTSNWWRRCKYLVFYLLLLFTVNIVHEHVALLYFVCLLLKYTQFVRCTFLMRIMGMMVMVMTPMKRSWMRMRILHKSKGQLILTLYDHGWNDICTYHNLARTDYAGMDLYYWGA